MRCGGNLVLTSSEGNIKKYLDISLEIASKYNPPQYIRDQINLLKQELDTIFEKKLKTQATLSSF